MLVDTTTARPTGDGRLVRSVAVLAIALATVALSVSGAVFTDSDDTAVADVTTGTLALDATTDIDFNVANMAPGDTGDLQTIDLDNAGSLQLRYDMSTAVTGSTVLAAELDLVIWDESAEVDTAIDGTCGTEPLVTLYDGAFDGAAITDEVVDGGASQRLCLELSLPLATGNSAQGLTTGATLTFDSEQTANN